MQSITEIRVRDDGGRAARVDPLHYGVDLTGEAARITARQGGWAAPTAHHGGIEIEFISGFGNAADDVPGDIRQAIVLLVAHWFEHRDPSAVGSNVKPLPTAVSGLLAPYKAVRL